MSALGVILDMQGEKQSEGFASLALMMQAFQRDVSQGKLNSQSALTASSVGLSRADFQEFLTKIQLFLKKFDKYI